MPTNNDPNEFYKQIVEGTDYTKTIDLEHSTGYKLEDVEVTPVNKQKLASVIERLPEEMFDAVDESADPDEAREAVEEADEVSMNAISADTVEAFEDLVSESISHGELTGHQMDKVVENLDFEILFELGADIIEISFERTGSIKDFHEQQ